MVLVISLNRLTSTSNFVADVEAPDIIMKHLTSERTMPDDYRTTTRIDNYPQ
ncbi:msr9717 (plasmid) [Mesorhizobium japonicum MAFF 303099]|uniref:Msr9717 protein n=1 Tax=Mesorhizobium japonicum (strain LMG 29417 / CECT 9101 / MAFF 303099) TaxID=266835 RepID=Q98NW1_RHILO|nr:msr9717 [Mesorhizobium japonicum MAFF 303099]